MSEQPTYWKHDRSGTIYRVDNAIGEDEFYPAWNFTENRTASINCNPREHNPATHVTQIPIPQVGEQWAGAEVGTVLVTLVECGQVVVKGIFHERDTDFSVWAINIDDFMLNYTRVEEKAEEEVRVNEWNEVVPLSAGFAVGETITLLPKEVNIKLNPATVVKMNDDATFTHTLPEEDIDAVKLVENFMNPSFTDKLKEEIARLDEDMQEIAEEIEGLSKNHKEMYKKREDWKYMLQHYTEFTDKYSDTLL